MLLQNDREIIASKGDPIGNTKSKSPLPLSITQNAECPSKRRTSPSLHTASVKTINWDQLHDVEYFERGGSSIIQTAFYDGKEVIVKILNPEYKNNETFKNDLEKELKVLSTLNHDHILKVYGAGHKEGERFLVLERLSGCLRGIGESKLNQKSKIWKQKKHNSRICSLKDGIKHARAIADAMQYCHEIAIPGCMLLHRDLKPSNIGKLLIFTLFFLLLITFSI